MAKQSLKYQNIIQFIIILLIIVLVNFIASSVHFRLDMTSGNRYKLKEVTKKSLNNLQDIVYIEVFLAGDMPTGFKRMQRSIKEELEEFKVYAGNNLEYEFINPNKDDPQERKAYFDDLTSRGLEPINLKHKDKEGALSQRIVFPGVIIHYKGNEVPVNLLKRNANASPEANLNNSIENLEYELIVAIKGLTDEQVEKIAFLEGHNELNQYEVERISREISKFYQVDRGNITNVNSLNDYKALFIAKPTKPFSKKEKLAIDQYIMNGGKVLWFIDKVSVNHDSLRKGSTIAMNYDLNISDLLFKYGVRINNTLIKDIHCNVIPVKTVMAGAQSQFSPAPWVYFPLLLSPPNHPVTKDMDLIKSEYANTIDTLAANKDLTHSVLLTSSEFAHEMEINTPKMIRLNEVEEPLNKEIYNESHLPVAVLLEGKFNSAFVNRPVQDIAEDADFKLTTHTNNNRMLVVADGDIIRNNVRATPRGTYVSPLGYDRYTKQTFGNKDFIINALHYLTDEEGFMQLRAKNIKLRLLNRTKTQEDEDKWIFINTAIPVIFIIVFGYIIAYMRKRKYAK